MLVALKQSKGNDTISEAELSYHARLTAAQSNHRKIVSDLLGWYNLDDYPQLGLAGHRISLEEFIPGLPAGHFFSTKHHLEMAKEVSRNFFSLIDLAKDAGLLTDLHRGLVISPTEPLPDFFSAQLPGDINPGNFILTPHHNAIFVDPGRYHPPHTFSQTLLRLISYYWWHRSETGSETMLPLAPLFTEVCQHFGRGRGISLLKEFRITLGFFYGTPQQQLKERFPHCPVDMIGRHYAALYGQDPDQGGTQWISRGIQRGRLAYQRRLPLPLGDRSPEADVRYFFESATLPFHFEEKDLRAMRHELDVFLGHHTFGIHLKPTEISTELYLRRVGHSPRTYDPKQPGPNKPKIIFNKKLSRIIAPVGRDLLNSAFYFSPFPDPAIARLAFITAKMRETGQISIDNFSDYLRSILSIGCVLYEFFQNDQIFTEYLANILEGSAINFFNPWTGQATKKSVVKPHAIPEDMIEKWVMTMVAIRTIYLQQNRNPPETFRDDSRWASVMVNTLRFPATEISRTINALFPEIQLAGGKFSNISAVDIASVKNAARQIAGILSSRHVPTVIANIPRLDLTLRP